MENTEWRMEVNYWSLFGLFLFECCARGGRVSRLLGEMVRVWGREEAAGRGREHGLHNKLYLFHGKGKGEGRVIIFHKCDDMI